MTGRNHIGTIGWEKDTIPDLIDPHVGWRAWFLEPHGEKGELNLRAYYQQKAFWLPGGDSRTPMIAECIGGRSHAPAADGSMPQVPVEGCMCGLYASTDPKWTLDYATKGIRDELFKTLIDSITIEELRGVNVEEFSESMSVKDSVEIVTGIFRSRGDLETAIAIEERRLPYGWYEDWNKRKEFKDQPFIPAAIFGTVNMWGKVIPHDTGYRASHSYPRELFVARSVFGGLSEQISLDLASRYGVPATVVESWDEVVEDHLKVSSIETSTSDNRNLS